MKTRPLPIPITSIDQERFMEVLEQLKIEVGNMKTNFENFLIPAPLEVPKPTAKKEGVVNFSTVGKKSEGFGSSLLKYALLFAVAFNDKVKEIAAKFIEGFLTQLGVNDKIISAVKWSILNFDKVLIAYLGFKVIKQLFGAFNSVQKLFKSIKTLFSLHTDQEFDRDNRIKQLDRENRNLQRKLKTSRELTKTAKAKSKARLERIQAKHKKKIIDIKAACNKRATKLKDRIKTNRIRANVKSNVINKIKDVLIKTKETFKNVAVAAKNGIKVVTQKLTNITKIVTHVKKFFGIVRKGLSVLRTGLIATGTALGPLGILLGFGAGLLIDAAIGTVIDLALDTEADPKESLFDKIIRVGLKNVFRSFSFGFLDDVPDWIKKRLGIPVKGEEGKSGIEQKATTTNIDPKAVNNWAYSVYIKKINIEQVPPQLLSKVEEILKNPPDNWKKAYSQQTNLPQPSGSQSTNATSTSGPVAAPNLAPSSAGSTNATSTSGPVAAPNLAPTTSAMRPTSSTGLQQNTATQLSAPSPSLGYTKQSGVSATPILQQGTLATSVSTAGNTGQRAEIGYQPSEYKQSREGASISSQISDLEMDLGISGKKLQSQMEVDSSVTGQEVQSLSETKTLSIKSAQKAMSGSPVIVVNNNNNTVVSNEDRQKASTPIVFSDSVGY